MSGIAGIVDLTAGRPLPRGALRRMSQAIKHRGPDQERIHETVGVGMVWRGMDGSRSQRLQPILSRDGSMAAVLQGRLFNESDLKRPIENGDPERPQDFILRLWETQGVEIFGLLRGQFALAIWDRKQHLLVLGRDRVGVSPLCWAVRDQFLLFASEIKALLASGLVAAEADRRGLDHVFTFLGMPAARTCFAGVQALLPGHYLIADLGPNKSSAPTIRRYWDLDFPDRGEERGDFDSARYVDELQGRLETAVRRRLEGETHAASYVSGGIDCSTLVTLAGRVRGQGIPTFTVRIDDPHFDESDRALRAARAGGSEPTVVTCGPRQIIDAYPQLIEASECPVSDTSCATLLLLAKRARQEGYSIALAGDGADDMFAGYPWFKIDRVMSALDRPQFRFSQWLRRAYLRIMAPHVSWANVERIQSLMGGHHAWLDMHGLISTSRKRFYSASMREALGGHLAQEDLTLNLERMRHWHPLNQDLYLGMKIHVPGLLLQAKGDRIAMHSSLELRYPFLDEDVIDFSTRIPPHWKLRGLRDKYVLRQLAARLLPRDIVRRPKSDFVAPMDTLYGEHAPAFVNELLSEESLRRTEYFDVNSVFAWRRDYKQLRVNSGKRLAVEIGLAAVVATQLWHHLFIDASLADLPSSTSAPAVAPEAAAVKVPFKEAICPELSAS